MSAGWRSASKVPSFSGVASSATRISIYASSVRFLSFTYVVVVFDHLRVPSCVVRTCYMMLGFIGAIWPRWLPFGRQFVSKPAFLVRQGVIFHQSPSFPKGSPQAAFGFSGLYAAREALRVLALALFSDICACTTARAERLRARCTGTSMDRMWIG